MKKHLLATFLFAAALCFSCNNSNNTTPKNTDTTVSGNTDSSGSQPIQPGPGSANGGNATDTLANHNEPAPRIDSVVRH